MPPTFTEHANLICTDMSSSGNTATGTKAVCTKDSKCLAYLVVGGRGRNCKGEIKLRSLLGLDVKQGDQQLFIKGMYMYDAL